MNKRFVVFAVVAMIFAPTALAMDRSPASLSDHGIAGNRTEERKTGELKASETNPAALECAFARKLKEQQAILDAPTVPAAGTAGSAFGARH